MNMRIRTRLLAGALLLASATPSFSAGLPPLVEPTLQAGCDWVLAFDPAVPEYGNTAYPETAARYWVAVVSDTVPAGSKLRIDGQYPDARYSAFHVHDGNVFTHDAIADYELLPLPGSVNRDLTRTRRDGFLPFGGSYTAHVVLNQAAPAVRAANTVYRAPPKALEGKAKKRTLLAYRTYAAVGGNQGKVPLPKLTLVTADGRQTPFPNAADAAACESLKTRLQNSNGSAAPVSLAPPLVPERKPIIRKFDGAVLTALQLGVGYNPHNGFMSTKGDRSYGDYLLVRGKLPSYTTQSAAQLTPQVRYWSLCQNGANSTMVYGCLSDKDVALDQYGYYTVAISTDTAQPVALSAARGFSWLNWGPEQVSAILIRELLASPEFPQSIEQAPTQAAQTPAARGDYMPVAAYCSRAVLNQYAPSGAAAAFQACLSSAPKQLLPGLL